MIKSYKKVSKFQSDYDEILVQKFITNVSMSGVVFTHEISSGAPYYVINYDDKTGLTDSITSGISKTDKTIYVYRNGTKNFKSPRFSSLIKAIKEIEKTYYNTPLDIEFAIDRNQKVYIFQVRPISAQKNWNIEISKDIDQIIHSYKSF